MSFAGLTSKHRTQPDWRVTDPAYGEGVFLECALERGAQQVIEIAPEPLERAREKLRPYDERVRLYLQDGLLPIQNPDSYWQSPYAAVVDYSRAESSSHQS